MRLCRPAQGTEQSCCIAMGAQGILCHSQTWTLRFLQCAHRNNRAGRGSDVLSVPDIPRGFGLLWEQRFLEVLPPIFLLPFWGAVCCGWEPEDAVLVIHEECTVGFLLLLHRSLTPYYSWHVGIHGLQTHNATGWLLKNIFHAKGYNWFSCCCISKDTSPVLRKGAPTAAWWKRSLRLLIKSRAALVAWGHP